MNHLTTDDQAEPTADGEVSVSRRATKKERTRNALIDAAADVIAERGFHAASLKEVAFRAGLTTGAVYSNFQSKEDLFLAVMRRVSVPFKAGEQSSPPWELLGSAAATAVSEVDLPASRRLLKLQLEFALLTIQNPDLLSAIVDDMRADRRELAALLGAAGPAPHPDFSPSRDELATSIIAIIQGLQQHRYLDRAGVSEELARWAVQALLHGAASAGSGIPC